MAGASTATKQTIRRARFAFGRFQNRVSTLPFVSAIRLVSSGRRREDSQRQVAGSERGLLDVDGPPRAASFLSPWPAKSRRLATYREIFRHRRATVFVSLASLLQPHCDAVGCALRVHHREPQEARPFRLEE